MAAIMLFGLAILALTAIDCSSNNGPPSKAKAIGLQPIGAIDPQHLAFVRNEASHFFGRRVIVLPAIDMPASFLDLSKGERYSADSIIELLAHKTNDSLSQVVGLTGKDIYTTYRDDQGKIRAPRYKYEVWGIMGLGFCPGKACIVSEFRLRTTDRKRFEHRLSTVVLHEIGHNLGLPHCPNKRCIMNDANGTISSVDNSAGDYCASCRSKLQAGRSQQ